MADLVLMLSVFAGSFVVGHHLISRVPAQLHTPLMSMTNALSAVTLLGALLLFAAGMGPVETAHAASAVALAAFNMVGGFVITHRMVGFFKGKGPSA
jgi:NAD(P) transhydrogenase subunit alpha